jgi:hypothetical protein
MLNADNRMRDFVDQSVKNVLGWIAFHVILRKFNAAQMLAAYAKTPLVLIQLERPVM